MSSVVFKDFERTKTSLISVVELDIDEFDKPLIDKYPDAYIDIGGIFNNLFIPQKLVDISDHLVIKQAFATNYPSIASNDCLPHELAAINWREEIAIRLEDKLAMLRARAAVECATPAPASLPYFARYWGTLPEAYFPLAASSIQSGNFDLVSVPSTAKTIYYNCSGGQRFWYAFPASWGKLELYGNSVNNLLFTGWANNITAGGYASPLEDGFTVTITDTNGNSVPYRVYMSAPVQNGSNIKVLYGDFTPTVVVPGGNAWVDADNWVDSDAWVD